MNTQDPALISLHIIRYFKEFRSVGVIRAIEDLESEGIPRLTVISFINKMIEKGILRHNEGVLTYVGQGGGGPLITSYVQEYERCSVCKSLIIKGSMIIKAYTFYHGRLMCLDCYMKLREKPKSHKDWIEEIINNEQANEAVKEALEEIREELEEKERRYERIKSKLDVSEEELVEFLRTPKTAKEIYERFGEDGLELVQILRREGKVWLKKIDGVWRYGIS